MKKLIWFGLVGLSLVCTDASAMSEKAERKTELQFSKMSSSELSKLVKGIEFPEQIDLSNPNYKGAKKEFVTPTYDVAQFDLNDDGVKEVFVYISGPAMCGSGGCKLNIYQKSTDQKYKNILLGPNAGVGTISVISVSENKTIGYRDIILSRVALWKWDGNYYQFSEKE